jgi:hypothetical protein
MTILGNKVERVADGKAQEKLNKNSYCSSTNVSHDWLEAVVAS